MQFGDVPEVLPTKQPFWDRHGVMVDKALVEATLDSPHLQVRPVMEFYAR